MRTPPSASTCPSQLTPSIGIFTFTTPFDGGWFVATSVTLIKKPNGSYCEA